MAAVIGSVLGRQVLVLDLASGKPVASTAFNAAAPSTGNDVWGRTNLAPLIPGGAPTLLGETWIDRPSQGTIRGVALDGSVLFAHRFPKDRSRRREFFRVMTSVLELDAFGHVFLRSAADFAVRWAWNCAEQQPGMPPSRRELPVVWENGGVLWLGINPGTYQAAVVGLDTATGHAIHRHAAGLLFGCRAWGDGLLLLKTSAEIRALDLRTGGLGVPLQRPRSGGDTYTWRGRMLDVGSDGLALYDWGKSATAWTFRPRQRHLFETKVDPDGHGGRKYAPALEDLAIRGDLVRFAFVEYEVAVSYEK